MKHPKVAIYTLATDKYIDFLADWVRTINEFMQFDFDLFVFTDQEVDIPGVTAIFVEHQPRSIICNYKILAIEQHKHLFAEYSDIMFIDVDSVVCLDINYDEIDSDDVFGVVHFGFPTDNQRPFKYEHRPSSAAYVAQEEGKIYYAGGVYGGKHDPFFTFCKRVADLMRADISEGITPIWLDESYINKVFYMYPPALVLGPEYNYNVLCDDIKILLVRKNNRVYHNL